MVKRLNVLSKKKHSFEIIDKTCLHNYLSISKTLSKSLIDLSIRIDLSIIIDLSVKIDLSIRIVFFNIIIKFFNRLNSLGFF